MKSSQSSNGLTLDKAINNNKIQSEQDRSVIILSYEARSESATRWLDWQEQMFFVEYLFLSNYS